MPVVLRWFRLGRPARARAMRALVWLLASRAALRLLPYRTVRMLVPRVPAARSRRPPISAAECEAAVRRAAAALPGSTCLARALAAACLLRRNGRASVLTIGVGFTGTAPSGRELQAHAWLESDGLVVVGAGQRAAFKPLLTDAIPAAR